MFIKSLLCPNPHVLIVWFNIHSDEVGVSIRSTLQMINWGSREIAWHGLGRLQSLCTSSTLLDTAIYCCCWVASVVSDSAWPHRQQPTRLPRPWDSSGKTGVGCHFLLQCKKVKSESEVAQTCPTLSDPMDCGLPGSSVHGIFQARVLEWGAIAFSDRGAYVSN